VHEPLVGGRAIEEELVVTERVASNKDHRFLHVEEGKMASPQSITATNTRIFFLFLFYIYIM
jgi:hypothetical protein